MAAQWLRIMLNPRAMDYGEHEKTYQSFIQLIKYTVAGVALLLALLAFFLG
jgi:Bacterial aa3 type cytochrome c oxidase subunit IV